MRIETIMFIFFIVMLSIGTYNNDLSMVLFVGFIGIIFFLYKIVMGLYED